MAGRKSYFCGDIGCYTLGNAMPLDMVDTCLCMGAGVNMTQGIGKIEPDTTCFAFVGDSTFFASAITGMVNAVYNQANMTLVADMLHISVSRVYSVATFYENFSLEPKGKHIIKVCAGTACHVRKSGPIYDAIYEYLGLSGKRKTSDDGMFTLETVACLGACGLAPVMPINEDVYGHLTPGEVDKILDKFLGVRGRNKR